MLPALTGLPIRVELRPSLGPHLAATAISRRLILLDSELEKLRTVTREHPLARRIYADLESGWAAVIGDLPVPKASIIRSGTVAIWRIFIVRSPLVRLSGSPRGARSKNPVCS